MFNLVLPIEIINRIFVYTNDIELIIPFWRYMSKSDIVQILQKNDDKFSPIEHKPILTFIHSLGIDWSPPLVKLQFWFNRNVRLAVPFIAYQCAPQSIRIPFKICEQKLITWND